MSKPTVAILGASADTSKYGYKSVKAHLANGYDVYPVNPQGGEIDGLKVYTSLDEVPVEHLTRISVYLPPAVALQMLDAIAKKGCDELFLNPGSESDELVARAEGLGLNPIQACSIINLQESR
ncbi:MAG: CoA-binding protein [Planctomycetales bacterium]|nr:CoA-binding protein [Planctomycetales bacterium]